ncbi:xanthine dehydrogenase family protein molybdopterin-binding subunit [Pseudomonas typographi]|uniref:Xanthine dehydrogenase family protein molybdopterin-binding subunit n=1 Tax=Pseudomonas typographi TaxID=2715964 RepID=A0ABR7Z5Y2_9PSED|nr:xanthine dehydrogenase family protein molybdopterin-binding subunit [Pseudomonas typographi]MBD1554310.1 xanthine dehydrogenase family protein molybdopterin-binding subunit [Pseudomonas typographi]MBD1589539.1 xanthine dehydrogenase family protein molybdopterin-binding subunit [Pseudomonas typographi]MBD1600919.1 xanthine dehydrogenase family protein molybdopterin-binding subunit [Pseudomonas typographi]
MAPSTSVTVIGQGLPRIDGPKKVSGLAQYTSDHHFPGLLYAVPVTSTVAKGRITALDPRAALAMPGVVEVFHQGNFAGKLFRKQASKGKVDENRPPLSDNTVSYYGQYVALVIARTFEQATEAARAVKVEYASEPPNVSMRLAAEEKTSVDTERGDVDQAFTSAPVKIDQVYTTPVQTHNPIELHASVAVWNGEQFTLFETSQAVMNHQMVMAQMLGVQPQQVRIITEYLGSGFGGKLWPWTHATLAAAAARELGAPIKLVVDRAMMFQTVGHRTNTQQRIRLGATADGKLNCVSHDYLFHNARLDTYKENCGEATGFLYSTPNLRAAWSFARRDIAPPTSMRGPGAVPGLYALESGMNELAVALKMDPLQLRLANQPERDESLDLPFSSRHLTECLHTGAERFGWARRDPRPGSMRNEAGAVVGWGMAACSWMAKALPAKATVQLAANGRARVMCGTQDIGTGTYTVVAQMVAALTGLPLARIDVVIGDSSLPPGPMSGGSMATGSLVPAVQAATQAAIDEALQAAIEHDPRFAGKAPGALAFDQMQVSIKGEQGKAVLLQDILQAAHMDHVSGEGEGAGSAEAQKHYSQHSYGAHFVEVVWQPEIARLRVDRVVTVIDAGKVINPQTGRNQIEGAIMMGVGMALFEETEYDPRTGAPLNANLADYIVTTHADAPEVDITFLDYPDMTLNPLGARGIGEIGLAGIAAAITDAVRHATGVQVRDLPVRIEDLLDAPVGLAS